ncbi:MAG: hypothetical protein ACI4VN_01745 [Clostridia bacterium]|nr:hypothetical protein [Clostridia bacterium]
MRTLVITSTKRRCKIIGRILKKAKNREHSFEFFFEKASSRIIQEKFELIIVDIESSEKIELLEKLLTDLMYAEYFPTILILSKEIIPEESIPIENCYQFLNELELAHHLKCLESKE